jgi:hypothetical protein
MNIINKQNKTKMAQFKNYTDYEITTNGLVISHKRTNPKVLKPQRATQSQKGYQQVRLYNSETPNGKLFYVHRLVWETFVDEIPENLEIDHLDEDTNNNSIENLQLMTRRENCKKFSVGRYGLDVRAIRDEILKDYELLGTQRKVAEKWGISTGTVWRVINNKVNSYKNGKQILIDYK